MNQENIDKRIHPRIQVLTEVRAQGSSGSLKGTLIDLSKGGAGVVFPKALGSLGDTIELFLPLPGNIEITIMAEIMRILENKEGVFHGFRFNLVEPALQEKLLSLIETLLESSGGKKRKHPRIVKRIPIKYGPLSELQAILENISLGGLKMTVYSPLALFEEIEVSIPDFSGNEFLILSGRVIYQNTQIQDGKTLYQVGIEFKNLTEIAKGCLNEFIKQILSLKS